MTKPITHELQHIWITADGRKFLNEEDAKKHQKTLIGLEKKEIREEIDMLEEKLKEFEKNQNTTSENVEVVYTN